MIHIDLDDILRERIHWNAAWDYVSEIMRDHSSHLAAALRGDKYVPTAAEMAAWTGYELWVNSQIKTGIHRVERPWKGVPPNYSKPVDAVEVTPERAARRAKLAAMF